MPHRRQFFSQLCRSLHFELLEDRRLLATTWTVNTLADENDGVALGGISFRDSLAACASGDTINFAASLTSSGPATITLTHGALAVSKTSLTITGPGASLLTIDASGNNLTPNGGITVTGLTFTGGDSNSAVGGVSAYAGAGQRVTISDCVIRNNFGAGGGGLYATGAISGGPPFLVAAGEVVVNNTTISNNSTSGVGGGIQASVVRLTISNSTVYGNTAEQGGGIACFGTTVQYGPGMFQTVFAVLSLSDSTISSNSTNGYGGGLDLNSTTTTCSRVTITANKADADNNGLGQGGGCYNPSGPFNSSNTIIAGNLKSVSTADEFNGFVTATYSIFGVNTGATISNNGGNQIGTSGSPINPLLGPLVNVGGSTLTHALLPGSPAINAGDPAPTGLPTYDQRGTPWARVVGGRLDIGAFESQPNPLPGDYNFNHVVDAADYLVWRITAGLSNDLRADGDGNGSVQPADYYFWRTRFGQTFGLAQSDAAPVEIVSKDSVQARAAANRQDLALTAPADSHTFFGERSFQSPVTATLPANSELNDHTLIAWLASNASAAPKPTFASHKPSRQIVERTADGEMADECGLLLATLE